MKSDLDQLMKAAGLDAVMVLGNAEHNPIMRYLTGGGHITDAALIKLPGKAPVIYCNAMEREEAARTGFKVVPLQTSAVAAMIKDPKPILAELGFERGRLGIYGLLDSGDLISLMAAVRRLRPDLELVGEPHEQSVFLRAMETKDADEVAHIRRMGKITTEVVGLVAEYLTGCDVRGDEVLLKADGSPLTVVDVKRKISLWLTERGAAEPQGCIFAIGRDAGVPHSMGIPDDPIRLGRTIVFDIFPAEPGGGYFYDFTRTWSLGHASADAQRLFNEVRAVYDKAVDNLDLNASFKESQRLVCDEFHTAGHNTPMHTQGVLENGYVHSVGHGVGLNIHERPASSHLAADDNFLRAGAVFTLEPGLYYPEKEIGIRIEDTYWMCPDGSVELLAAYPYDFVLPMRNRPPSEAGRRDKRADVSHG